MPKCLIKYTCLCRIFNVLYQLDYQLRHLAQLSVVQLVQNVFLQWREFNPTENQADTRVQGTRLKFLFNNNNNNSQLNCHYTPTRIAFCWKEIAWLCIWGTPRYLDCWYLLQMHRNVGSLSDANCPNSRIHPKTQWLVAKRVLDNNKIVIITSALNWRRVGPGMCLHAILPGVCYTNLTCSQSVSDQNTNNIHSLTLHL